MRYHARCRCELGVESKQDRGVKSEGSSNVHIGDSFGDSDFIQ